MIIQSDHFFLLKATCCGDCGSLTPVYDRGRAENPPRFPALGRGKEKPAAGGSSGFFAGNGRGGTAVQISNPEEERKLMRCIWDRLSRRASEASNLSQFASLVPPEAQVERLLPQQDAYRRELLPEKSTAAATVSAASPKMAAERPGFSRMESSSMLARRRSEGSAATVRSASSLPKS